MQKAGASRGLSAKAEFLVLQRKRFWEYEDRSELKFNNFANSKGYKSPFDDYVWCRYEWQTRVLSKFTSNSKRSFLPRNTSVVVIWW